MKTKKAIVTGASSGIGNAICHKLLDNDYNVIGIARDFPQDGVNSRRFTAAKIDLSKLDALADEFDKLPDRNSSPDILVCCAGKGQFGSLEEFSYQQIRDLIDLNFTSQALVARFVIPLMKKNNHGDIVFIGSEAAVSAGRKGAIYSATKFALRGMAQALREECAKNNIRVSVINPGMVKTNFFNELSFEPGDSPDNYILPEDIADAVLMVTQARAGTVFDEINLSPQKKVVHFKKPDRK